MFDNQGPGLETGLVFWLLVWPLITNFIWSSFGLWCVTCVYLCRYVPKLAVVHVSVKICRGQQISKGGGKKISLISVVGSA